MKKILPAIVLASLLVTLLLPVAVLGQEGPPEGCTTGSRDLSSTITGCTANTEVGEDDFDEWGLCCMLNTIYTVTDWLFYIMILIAVVMAIVGGFMYMTAAGDPEKAGKGKSVLIFAMIGFAIALLSKAIPSIVRAVMGM